MGLDLDFVGLDDLVVTIQKLSDLQDVKALDRLARKVEAEATKRAPRVTGFLRGSSQVDKSGSDRIIRFTAEYALAQHEKTEWQHDKGRSKYLSSALRDVVVSEAADVLTDLLAEKGFD